MARSITSEVRESISVGVWVHVHSAHAGRKIWDGV